ncbi:MAG: flagellar basal body rod protein FlgC [Gammaproteobacteria bacterium]|nr:flagellar basal body rod protein FlgC [Gammaproteobacteria bacterium]MDH5276381.1 flagellar basal body rod protein FlgC [Gammaproteobacteria bacterium]
MSLFKIFDIAGSAMSAQSVRLNTTASNLANANTIAGSAETAYRSRQPVFQTVMDNSAGMAPESAGVRVAGVVETSAPPARIHEPGNPLADADGYIYMSNVNPVDELVNMISASRSYQNSVEVLSTSKELLLRTLSIGQ